MERGREQWRGMTGRGNRKRENKERESDRGREVLDREC